MMRQAGMGVDIYGFEIISSKHYLVGKCLKNGKHNKVERFRRVTNHQNLTCNVNQAAHNV